MSKAEFDLEAEVKHLKDVLNPLVGLFEQLHPLLLKEREALKARNLL